jgi:HSP20 family protein
MNTIIEVKFKNFEVMNMIKFYSPDIFEPRTNRFFNQLTKEVNLYVPETNIIESEKKYVIEMAVPGFEKKQIEMKLEREKLIIKGSANNRSDENTKWISKEFEPASFERSFSIGRTLNTEEINAQLVNGILSVSIAKRVEQKVISAKEIKIS